MLCHKCNTQCFQYKNIGTGNTDIDYYDTVDVKQCPTCKTKYLEGYYVFQLTPNGSLTEGIADISARILHTIKQIIKQLINDSIYE